MRKESKTLEKIKRMYEEVNLNRHEVLHKTKLLLSIYRDVVWASVKRTYDFYESALSLYGQSLNHALTYLSEFAPTEDKKDFEAKVSNLFQTKWMVNLIDSAMIKINEYPENGHTYYEILSKCYLTPSKYKDSEIINEIHMERSVYYERKKEAMMLLGITLWGYTIPLFLKMHDSILYTNKIPTLSRPIPD